MSVSEVGFVLAGLVMASLLAVLGFESGSWRALRWALIVPVAALAVDILTFSPLSLQRGPEANVYTPVALYMLPAWLLPVVAGALARGVVERLSARSSASA